MTEHNPREAYEELFDTIRNLEVYREAVSGYLADPRYDLPREWLSFITPSDDGVRVDVSVEFDDLLEGLRDVCDRYGWDVDTLPVDRSAFDVPNLSLRYRHSFKRANADRRRATFYVLASQIDWKKARIKSWSQRRIIVRDHLHKLYTQRALASLLERPTVLEWLAKQGELPVDQLRDIMTPSAFETYAVDRKTGKRYLFTTDADGSTTGALVELTRENIWR